MLRTVRPSDVQIFFEHQRDPVATDLAAFPSRQREAFEEHWTAILADPDNWVRTIEVDGRVPGYVCAFRREGVWEIAYWLGRDHWGAGIASRAVAEFLTIFEPRPVHASVVAHNRPSIRVLEKAGFRVVERRRVDDGIEEVVLMLDA